MPHLSKKLNSGYECPMLGYGSYLATNPDELKTALKAAVKAGYRHIDTAQVYGNEATIGETLTELYAEGVIKREDMFLTTKLWLSHFKPEVVLDQIKRQLANLKTDYIDLYLLHFPVPLQYVDDATLFPRDAAGNSSLARDFSFEQTWAKLEEAVGLGFIRSIGISNFNASQVERLLKIAKIKPAMNQCEMHPFFQQTKLIEACHKHGVDFTAYSSFGNPGYKMSPRKQLNVFENPVLLDIGAKYGKKPSQVILRWQVQLGVFVIPKSVTPARVVENYEIWDFELNAEDMAKIKAMDEDERCVFWDLLGGVKEHPDYPFTTVGSC